VEQVAQARQLLAELAVGEVVVEEHSRRLVAPVSGGGSTLVEVLRRLDAAGLTVLDVALRRPTLDDVFLSLTGHAAEDDAAAAAAGAAGSARITKEPAR
jgi:ABC-2 type transport system ATP-binding protein